MKRVTHIVTLDGKPHLTEKDARRHLDTLLSNVVCPLSHRLSNANHIKRAEMLAETELETFRQILRITDDMKLENNED